MHSTEPKALRDKLLAQIEPAAVVHPFDRLMAQARHDAAARRAAQG